jgi:hypothetical protein
MEEAPHAQLSLPSAGGRLLLNGPKGAFSHRLFSVVRQLRLFLLQFALLLVITPRRNNLYCTIQPYLSRGKAGPKIFTASAGKLSKMKGMNRRSLENRRRLYGLAAFTLLRFNKTDRHFRFLIVRMKHFYETLRTRNNSMGKTHNLVRSILRPFLRPQLARRYPMLYLQLGIHNLSYAPKGYPLRSRKHKTAPKKKSF